LDPAEAAAGINNTDSFSPPTGFVSPITDHADYRLTLSGNDMAFLVSGNTITVSPVPLPATVWLFGSGVARLAAWARRRMTA
jgi:hypothetical protein